MLLELFGWIGTLLILLAYFLVSTKRVAAQGGNYQLLNLFGALILITYTGILKVWPAVALNAVWVTIAIRSLLKNRR